MEDFVDFDLDRWMNGEPAIDITSNTSYLFKARNYPSFEFYIDGKESSEFISNFLYCRRLRMRSPKEESIWSEWFQHDGSECPIPDVKAGDYEITTLHNPDYVISPMGGALMWAWKPNGIGNYVNTYRIKKHLLKPKVFISVDLAKAGEDSSVKWTRYRGFDVIPTTPINKPYTPKDQYILNYVHDEPKGVLHEDEGMSRLFERIMR